MDGHGDPFRGSEPLALGVALKSFAAARRPVAPRLECTGQSANDPRVGRDALAAGDGLDLHLQPLREPQRDAGTEVVPRGRSRLCLAIAVVDDDEIGIAPGQPYL